MKTSFTESFIPLIYCESLLPPKTSTCQYFKTKKSLLETFRKHYQDSTAQKSRLVNTKNPTFEEWEELFVIDTSITSPSIIAETARLITRTALRIILCTIIAPAGIIWNGVPFLSQNVQLIARRVFTSHTRYNADRKSELRKTIPELKRSLSVVLPIVVQGIATGTALSIVAISTRVFIYSPNKIVLLKKYSFDLLMGFIAILASKHVQVPINFDQAVAMFLILSLVLSSILLFIMQKEKSPLIMWNNDDLRRQVFAQIFLAKEFGLRAEGGNLLPIGKDEKMIFGQLADQFAHHLSEDLKSAKHFLGVDLKLTDTFDQSKSTSSVSKICMKTAQVEKIIGESTAAEHLKKRWLESIQQHIATIDKLLELHYHQTINIGINPIVYKFQYLKKATANFRGSPQRPDEARFQPDTTNWIDSVIKFQVEVRELQCPPKFEDVVSRIDHGAKAFLQPKTTSVSDINKAYLKMSKFVHPDKNIEHYKFANELFKLTMSAKIDLINSNYG